MEDTVLSVHHLSPPRRRSGAWPLAAAAALGLGVFFATGAYAVTVARQNHAALKTFVDAGNAPLDFRARRISPYIDAVAISGLASGLAFAAWALWRRRSERQLSSFRAADGTTLVEHVNGEWRFTPAPGMTAAAARIEKGAPIRAVAGPVSYLVSAVAPPRAAEGVAAHVDRRTLAYAGASAVAHAVLVALFFLLPATASGFSSDNLDGDRRRMPVKMFGLEDPKRERLQNGEGGQGGDTQSSAKELGNPGALGSKTATSETGKAKIKKVNEQPSISRPQPTDVNVHDGGALGVIHSHRAQMEAMTATADFTSGLQDEDIRGGYMGSDYREAYGGWGSAPKGRGPGGGGLIPGTIGVGPPRTPYTMLGMPPGVLRDRKPGPKFEQGRPEVPDGVDANTIRRYVRQKRAEITWCYQKELATRPNLSGTATTAFTIDANGRVIKANATGLGAPAVEQCIAEVIRGIGFPKGQIVNVTAYPFTFHPVGS